MRRGQHIEAGVRLPFIYGVMQTSMRYPAHITHAANEQQSGSSFGLMIRLLLVLPLLLFHSGAMAALNTPPSISLAGILSAYTEGDGTKTPASGVTITAGDSGSPNFTTTEIQRIAKTAFELAKKRKNKVTSCEKSNVMEAGVLWREEVQALKDKDFKDVELQHMLADNCAMQLLRNPKQFDVIVTDNLFGDMLSDQASMLTGSLGLLPSASLGAKNKDGEMRAMYEPIHGSAPDIAGKGLANPIATVLSFAMALRYSLDLDNEADALENAVQAVLNDGLRTKDILSEGMKEVSTSQMGDAIISKLQ